MINEFLKTMSDLFKDLDKNIKWVISAIGYILLSNIGMILLINYNDIRIINSLLFLNSVILILIGSYLMVIYQQNKLTISYFNTIIKATEIIINPPSYDNIELETDKVDNNEYFPSITKPGIQIKITKPFLTWNISELENLLKWSESVEEYEFSKKIIDRISELRK